MTLENALDTYLKQDSTLSTATGGRIYWMNALQTAILPYVVYRTIVDDDQPIAFAYTDTGRSLVQFDVVGANKAAKSILLRIRALIRGRSGSTGSINIYDVQPGAIREAYNPDTDRYVFTADYNISYSYS